MKEKEHLDKEELVSGYIDGQLTPRQMTELKRLLAHDSNFHNELEAMERQRQLLQSLPVETAPVLMVEEIRSALERRFILADTVRSVDKSEVWGLRLRKVAAVAAMILAPLLVLSGVVYTILQPAKSSSDATVGPIAMETQIQSGPLFSAVLQFQTGQPVATNDFVEKKIHSLGLMDFTTSSRQSDRSSYKIICSRRYIEGLVGELGELWPRSEKISYVLLDTSTNQPVRIESIDPQQTLAMIQLRDITAAAKLAQDFSQQNAQRIAVQAEPAPQAQPILPKESKPILAWDKDNPQISDDKPDTICLVIEVLGQ